MIGQLPKQIEKYGKKVWEHPDMEKLRQSECLCLNCEKLGDCSIADNLYHTCKRHDVALAVTRCPDWTPVTTT